jgi:hypothetical protein
MDYANVRGWNVRVYVRSRPVEPKLFSDGVHGGKQRAHAAARRYRDQLLKKYHIAPTGQRGVGYHEIDPRNRSGVVGVSLQKTRRASGRVHFNWSARYMMDGKQRNQTFSIQQYGYTRAFNLAVRCRYENTGRQPPRRSKPPSPSAEVRRWLSQQGMGGR